MEMQFGLLERELALLDWKKKLWNRQFKRLGMQFYAQQLENKITRTRHITKPMKFLK
jgi:hypothetical protein